MFLECWGYYIRDNILILPHLACLLTWLEERTIIILLIIGSNLYTCCYNNCSLQEMREITGSWGKSGKHLAVDFFLQKNYIILT